MYKKHHPQRKEFCKNFYQFILTGMDNLMVQEENFGVSKLGKVRKYLWNLTEYPETSFAAQVPIFKF